MAVDEDDVDNDDDRDMFLLSLLLFSNAALQSGPCDLPLVWVHVRVVQASGCNGLWPLIVIHHRVSVPVTDGSKSSVGPPVAVPRLGMCCRCLLLLDYNRGTNGLHTFRTFCRSLKCSFCSNDSMLAWLVPPLLMVLPFLAGLPPSEWRRPCCGTVCTSSPSWGCTLNISEYCRLRIWLYPLAAAVGSWCNLVAVVALELVVAAMSLGC